MKKTCISSSPHILARWSTARGAAKGFQRSYWKLFRLAAIKMPRGDRKRCHPHMFRDTFAVDLLLAGVPIDQVSLLLSHSSVKITERHYAPFCKARQEQLAAAVKLAWQKAKTPAKKGPARSKTDQPRVLARPRPARESISPRSADAAIEEGGLPVLDQLLDRGAIRGS